MKEREVDVAIIGGGPAGLAAAVAAKKAGAGEVLIIERAEALGGILNQCIHDGFGVEILKESLSGPEFAQKLIDEVEELKVPYLLDTMVLNLSAGREIIAAGREGLTKIKAKSVVLAMGCRERTRGMIAIPGSRPAGVYTAGCAQNLVNLKNYMVGERVVILGSGDVGLIMARRMTLEGAKVLAVVEVLPYSCGLTRNVVQCLEDYDIPLYLKHTVTEIHGSKRVEAVTISEVDEKWNPVPGSEEKIECDTLLLSVGLIPENELSKQAGVELDERTGGAVVDESLMTSAAGIFAAGNVLHVHDLVDHVVVEARKAGERAAKYTLEGGKEVERVEIKAGEGVNYVVPQKINLKKSEVELRLRVTEPGRGRKLVVADGGKVVKELARPRLNPAEMEKISLKAEELAGIKSLEVSARD